MIAMTVNPGFAVAASADTGDSVHAVTFMTTDEGGILELDEHFAREEKEASPSDAYVATVSDATVSNASASDAEDELEDGEIHADSLSYVDDEKSQVGIEIHSGRNRIVRRIFEHLGYKIKKLDRVYFAGLTKKALKRGEWRFLTEQEIAKFMMGSFE